MNTITIGQHQVPVQDRLLDAFHFLYAHNCLPLAVRERVDPKCRISQNLTDDYQNALVRAFQEYADSLGLDDAGYDQVMEELEEHVLDEEEAIWNQLVEQFYPDAMAA